MQGRTGAKTTSSAILSSRTTSPFASNRSLIPFRYFGMVGLLVSSHLLFPPCVASQVVPNAFDPPCFAADLASALGRIRAAGPAFAAMLDALNASGKPVVVTRAGHHEQMRVDTTFGSLIW